MMTGMDIREAGRLGGLATAKKLSKKKRRDSAPAHARGHDDREVLMSPYLKTGRLADVIAAVQFMGASGRPEADILDWTQRLSGNKEESERKRWTAVFKEHPEFFHVYILLKEPKAALREICE
jgi:hypothetical protein